MKTVKVGGIEFANNKPLVLIGGLNVLESRDMTMAVAEVMVRETARLKIPYVFKASFDKANRSSRDSFRGPGLEAGLRMLEEVRTTFGSPVITDVHLPSEAAPTAEVCDILQVPAFLARQTDIIAAIAATGKAVNVKKPQFMSPHQIANVVDNFEGFGNNRVLLCERGACFGYDNLVVDMLGFGVMKQVTGGSPIIFDATHSLQMRMPGSKSSGGRREQLLELVRAGVAVGIAGLFLEAHPDPDRALCDGPSALPIDKLSAVLDQVKGIDEIVKSFPAVVLN